jgi:hypothetical protein
MTKFLVLYYAPVSAAQQMASATPEQAKAGMEAWMAWAKKAGGAIVELGAPLSNGKRLEGSSVSNSGTMVAGYSIVQADSMETVTTLLKDHPHLRMPQFSIEVFEALPMPGM